MRGTAAFGRWVAFTIEVGIFFPGLAWIFTMVVVLCRMTSFPLLTLVEANLLARLRVFKGAVPTGSRFRMAGLPEALV